MKGYTQLDLKFSKKKQQQLVLGLWHQLETINLQSVAVLCSLISAVFWSWFWCAHTPDTKLSINSNHFQLSRSMCGIIASAELELMKNNRSAELDKLVLKWIWSCDYLLISLVSKNIFTAASFLFFFHPPPYCSMVYSMYRLCVWVCINLLFSQRASSVLTAELFN